MNHRYTTLDGLRGSAAIAVMFFHADTISPVRMPGGYLAVDLFFVLSGFVIAAAYLNKFETMGPSGFIKRRFVRLYPTYLAGILFAIGGAALVAFSRGESLNLGAVVTALVILPWPAKGYLFPVYPPAWSLFFEWISNLGMAISSKFFGSIFASVVLITSGAAVLIFGFQDRQISQGVYWSAFFGGLARAVFSFTLGICLQRLRPPTTMRRTRWAIALPIVLFALLAVDVADRLLLDSLCVFAFFPAMIWFGARIESPNAGVMKLVGDASYPLYCFHGTVLLLALAAARRFTAFEFHIGLIATTLAFAISLIFARFMEAGLRARAASMIIKP